MRRAGCGESVRGPEVERMAFKKSAVAIDIGAHTIRAMDLTVSASGVSVEKALVICLPGKPSGAVECLSFVVGAIPHCVEVLQEVPTSC